MREKFNRFARTYQDFPFWLSLMLLAAALILEALAALLR